MGLFESNIRESQVTTLVNAITDEREAWTNPHLGESGDRGKDGRLAIDRAQSVLTRAKDNSTFEEIKEATRRT